MKNNRTFLEKLLDGAEVEWKTLDEISSIYGGLTGKGKADFENGNALYVPYKNIFNNIEVDFNSLETVNVSNDEKQYTIKYGDVLFTGSSETAEEAGMSSAVTTKTEQKIYLNSFSFGLRFNDDVELLPEFSKFLFRTLSIRKEIVKSASGVTRFNISKARFKKIKIPIPPLSVQTEIVRILDALTALTSELTSELTLRRKQYEYYREKLLSEEELGKVGFKWKTLEELVENTQNIRWKNNTKTYRYIDLTSVDRENNNITGTTEINALNAPSRAQKIVKENDVIFATTRPTQQRVALISKEFSDEIASTGYCVLRAKTNIVLPKWLFYFLSTINFKNYVEENQSGSAYPAISDSKVKEFRIPIPEVTIQQSIIEKLDKFYSLTNSLLHGLPKEINNRTKQYSYYQKELLNFLGREIYE